MISSRPLRASLSPSPVACADAACAEGLSLLAVPHLWLRFARRLIAAPRRLGGAMIVVGAYLLGAGLVGHLGPPV